MPNARYCDYCGKQIRYGHLLRHPEWPEAIVVCVECATRLTGHDCHEHEQLLRAKQAANPSYAVRR